MWNSYFDVKESLVEVVKSFPESTLKKNLEILGFSCTSTSHLTDKRLLLTFGKDQDNFLILSAEFQFDRDVIEVSFSGRVENSSTEKKVESHLLSWFKQWIEENGNSFILAMLDRGESFAAEDDLLLSNCLFTPVGDAAKQMISLLKELSLTYTNAPLQYMKLFKHPFFDGTLYVQWNLKGIPSLEFVYSSRKSGSDFLMYSQNILRKVSNKDELNGFLYWLEGIQSYTRLLVREAFTNIQSIDPTTKMGLDKDSFTVPDLALFEIFPAIKNYTIGFILNSPGFNEAFFPSKEDILQAVELDYIGKRDSAEANDKIVKELSSFGKIDASPISYNILSCFGEEIRYRISYEIKNGSISYRLFCPKIDDKAETLSHCNDIVVLTESAIKEIKKYIHSIRLRSLFKEENKASK